MAQHRVDSLPKGTDDRAALNKLAKSHHSAQKLHKFWAATKRAFKARLIGMMLEQHVMSVHVDGITYTIEHVPILRRHKVKK